MLIVLTEPAHKYILLLLWLIWATPAVHQAKADEDGENPIISRLNYGIIFKHVDTLDVCTVTWMQTFVIKMPIAWNFTISHASVNCYTMQPSTGCDRVIHLVDYLYNTTAKTTDKLNRTLDSVYKLISHFSVEDVSSSNRSRVERGLLNFVRELSHPLFVTARDKDIAVTCCDATLCKESKHYDDSLETE